jgi:hypothetical protein
MIYAYLEYHRFQIVLFDIQFIFKKIPICDECFSGNQAVSVELKTNISEISIPMIGINVILTLMMKMEKMSEILVLNSTLT